MKYITLIALFSLLIIQSLAVCSDENCCEAQQSANPTDGNGYQEYNPTCATGGLNCVGNSGCHLCYKPIFASTNIGNRPICARFNFLTINAICFTEACCEANDNPNSSDGNGFLEYNPSCLNGGLNCVANSGCQLCYSPVLGSTNVGNRPICKKNIVIIRNLNSGLYLNVNGASTALGAGIIQWNNPTAPETQWIVVSVPLTNRVVFQNVHSGLYLNVNGASMTDGAGIIQWNNPTAPETQWTILSTTPAGTVNIQNFHSGLDLNVNGASITIGANIIQWDNPTAPETKWVLTQVV
jgi:hypothetical protein